MTREQQQPSDDWKQKVSRREGGGREELQLSPCGQHHDTKVSVCKSRHAWDAFVYAKPGASS